MAIENAPGKPLTVRALQTVVGSTKQGSALALAPFATFAAQAVEPQPAHLRDLLEIRPAGPELALEQIALLCDEESVAPSRIVISHMGDRRDFSTIACVAETGVYLSVDNVGYNGDGYPGDDVRAANVARLIATGHLDQVMLSLDICTKDHLHANGGKGYAWLQESFLPRLRSIGVTEEQIARMTVENPRRALNILE